MKEASRETGSGGGGRIQLRHEMRLRRKALSQEEKRALDHQLLKRLMGLPELWTQEVVYCYASFGREADTLEFLKARWSLGLPVALPRVEGSSMRFYLTRGEKELAPGFQGILEPLMACPPAGGCSGPVIAPGLAFGRDGSRLGYGGGYYDRFFFQEPEHWRIGLAYPFQLVPEVEQAAWDQSVDMIVSSEEILCCQRLRRKIDGSC